jgi:WD40 repeat protein
VWNASTGAALQQLKGHTDWVRSVAFSYDGTQIVSGSDDNSVRVWDAAFTDAELQQLNGKIVSGSDVLSSWVWNRMLHGVLWTSTIDGWIVSLPYRDRLVWIPQGIHEVIHHPYNTLIISQQGYAHVDLQHCDLGTKWAECYKPLLV